MSEDAQKTTASNSDKNAQFAIQKVYIKDLSFESPNTPSIFPEKWTPEVNLQLQSYATRQSETVHEVVLTATVTAKLGDQTAYLAEVQQAGLFTIKGLEQKDLEHTLGSFCPNILFPFAREALADLVVKGGFPQLLLAPVNFDALYAQAQREKKAQQRPQEAKN